MAVALASKMLHGMGCALQRRGVSPSADHDDIVHDFYAPFHGLAGAWRLMSLPRWGKPAEVLASIPGQLPELFVPALIFHGKRDATVPSTFAMRAASLIPASEVILLESGHFLPLSEPETIARELVRFFGADHRTESQLPAAAD